MTIGNRPWHIISGISLILFAASVAQADSFTQLTSPPGGTDTFIFNSLGSAGTVLTSGVNSVTSSGGDTVTIGFQAGALANIDGNAGLLYAEGANYDGSPGTFGASTYLIGTNDYNDVADSITLSFNPGISAIGLYIEDYDISESFTADIQANGQASPFTASSPNGSAIFIGLQDNSGANITSVTFSVPTVGTDDADYFVIGPGTIVEGNVTVGPTPEPASMWLTAGGIALLAWLARKRVRA